MLLRRLIFILISQKNTLSCIGILPVLISAIILSGCSEFLRGKPQQPDAIEIQSGSMSCLKNVSDDLQKFLDSKATETELDSSVTCVADTLTEFQKKVIGRAEADAFTSDEIFDIFTAFVKDARLSREAAQNLILLKAALIGGDKEKITKAEIVLLKDYLLIVKAEAKKLIPFVKVFYLRKTDREYSKAYISQAFQQLNQTLKTLLLTSKISQSAYSFENFRDLVVHLLRLSEVDASRVDILAKVNVVLNGSQTELSDAERLQYIDSLTEFLRLLAMQVNGYAQIDLSTPDRLSDTLDFLEQVVALLENSMQYKKSGFISVAGIDSLMTAIVDADILPFKISAETIKDFYRSVFVRVFESGYYGNVAGFYGIKLINFIHIKRELAVYRVYSRMLEKISTPQSNDLITDLQARFALLNPADETAEIAKADRNNQLQIIGIVNDLRKEFLQNVPVIFKNGRLGIAQNQNTWTQSWKDLAQAFSIKMLTRFLVLGWAPTYQVMNTSSVSIGEIGMIKWYAEFKQFGIDTKMLDPRVANAGISSLKAGNLFTRSGEGNNTLSFKEAFEYLSTLVSGGKAIAGEIRQSMTELHCNLSELDVFGNNFNSESCLYQTLRSRYKVYFSTLPYLVAYLDRLDDLQFHAFFEKVLNVVRQNPANALIKVESSEVAGLSSLMYFIEALYADHDTNSSFTLSESEIRAAYPKFFAVATEFAHATSQKQIDQFKSWEGDVAGYGCFSEADLIRESFVFLVYNGRTPGLSDFNILPCVRGKPLLSFSGEVDRTQIVTTFKALSAILK